MAYRIRDGGWRPPRNARFCRRQGRDLL